MQDHLDQLLVEPGHANQIAGVLRIRAQERSLDRRLPVNTGQRLPDALVGQGWLDLGWDGSQNSVARLRSRDTSGGPGCHSGRGEQGDSTREASANLGRTELV